MCRRRSGEVAAFAELTQKLDLAWARHGRKADRIGHGYEPIHKIRNDVVCYRPMPAFGLSGSGIGGQK